MGRFYNENRKIIKHYFEELNRAIPTELSDKTKVSVYDDKTFLKCFETLFGKLNKTEKDYISMQLFASNAGHLYRDYIWDGYKRVQYCLGENIEDCQCPEELSEYNEKLNHLKNDVLDMRGMSIQVFDFTLWFIDHWSDADRWKTIVISRLCKMEFNKFYSISLDLCLELMRRNGYLKLFKNDEDLVERYFYFLNDCHMKK